MSSVKRVFVTFAVFAALGATAFRAVSNSLAPGRGLLQRQDCDRQRKV